MRDFEALWESAERQIDDLQERIADLEAEVERLRERKEMIVELWSAGLDMELSRQLQEWDAEDERGGRESETPGGGTSPSGVSPSPPQVCRFCGLPVEPERFDMQSRTGWVHVGKQTPPRHSAEPIASDRRKAAAEPAALNPDHDTGVCPLCKAARKEAK